MNNNILPIFHVSSKPIFLTWSVLTVNVRYDTISHINILVSSSNRWGNNKKHKPIIPLFTRSNRVNCLVHAKAQSIFKLANYLPIPLCPCFVWMRISTRTPHMAFDCYDSSLLHFPSPCFFKLLVCWRNYVFVIEVYKLTWRKYSHLGWGGQIFRLFLLQERLWGMHRQLSK